MGKSHSWPGFRAGAMLMPLLAPLFSAACSGGGSNPAPAPSPAPATSSSTAPTVDFCCSKLGPPSMGAAFSTGFAAGPIAAPPPATFGTAAKQTALPGGPSFDGSSGVYPANVTFPLISTGLQPASPGFSALTGNQNATLTVISSSGSSASVQLVIPGANVNTTVGQNGLVQDDNGFIQGFSYVAIGQWGQFPSPGNSPQSATAFVFGYETPTTAMPANGTANFSGSASANVFKTVGPNILLTAVSGNANLSVNFGSGQVTGAFTNMQQWDGKYMPAGNLPWNDVSLTAGIGTGSNKFSGSTAVTSTPGTTFSLAGTATGHIDGAFYGPAAQDLGAVWSLSDGTASALGELQAKQ